MTFIFHLDEYLSFSEVRNRLNSSDSNKSHGQIKLSQSKANELLNLPDYSSLYKCRDSYGGVVSVLIKNSLKFIQIFDLDHFNLEIVTLKILVKTNSSNLKELFIFSYYHPSDPRHLDS